MDAISWIIYAINANQKSEQFSNGLIDRLRQLLSMPVPTIKHNGRSNYDVQMTDKGHDCPAEPKFIASIGVWLCSSCEWEYRINENQCMICGFDEKDSPVIHENAIREQFINFKHPFKGEHFGLHSSCAIYGVIEDFLKLEPIHDDDDGEAA